MKNHNRHRLGHPFALPPRWKWLTIPVVALGGAGTTVAIVLEEEALSFATCGPLAAIPLLAAPLFWLSWAIFKHNERPARRSAARKEIHE